MTRVGDSVRLKADNAYGLNADVVYTVSEVFTTNGYTRPWFRLDHTCDDPACDAMQYPENVVRESDFRRA